ncbi:hypothetical protein BDW67DRAFT_158961 [Aspergillus spinulosporus]
MPSISQSSSTSLTNGTMSLCNLCFPAILLISFSYYSRSMEPSTHCFICHVSPDTVPCQ